MTKEFHTGTLKKSIRIYTAPDKAWNKLSKIAELHWLDGINSSKFLSEKTRGVGTIRRISFLDGTIVKEIVVGWKPKNYFSYIAVSGLPLRGYHATISIVNKKNKHVDVEWESFFSSKQMTNDEFRSFFMRLSNFYTESLKNLKNSLEK